MHQNRQAVALTFFTLLLLAPLAVLKQRGIATKTRMALPVLLAAKAENKIYRLDLEDYLIGVVSAEMPAEFSLEALKAQAVASRTLAVRRMKRFGGKGTPSNQKADFSDDPNECQAWLSRRNLINRWGGWEFHRYYRRIERAVRETAGIIIVYNNQPIDAVFHSTCGVGTDSAAAIWSENAPYLKRVRCGFDKHSPRFKSSRFDTWSALARIMNIPENSLRQITVVRRTAGGRVVELTCGSYRISGRDFRQKLSLNSLAFTLEKRPAGLNIKVIGYGHGVGMCQYGADGLAKRGWKYPRILRYYYQGIKFLKIKNYRG